MITKKVTCHRLRQANCQRSLVYRCSKSCQCLTESKSDMSLSEWCCNMSQNEAVRVSISQSGCVSHVKPVTCMPSKSFYHYLYAPPVVNRSAVIDFHRSRSCATLIQSLYDIFVHSLMLSVHIVLGLPRPLLPFILPSISNRCTPFPLIICPKY